MRNITAHLYRRRAAEGHCHRPRKTIRTYARRPHQPQVGEPGCPTRPGRWSSPRRDRRAEIGGRPRREQVRAQHRQAWIRLLLIMMTVLVWARALIRTRTFIVHRQIHTVQILSVLRRTATPSVRTLILFPTWRSG